MGGGRRGGPRTKPSPGCPGPSPPPAEAEAEATFLPAVAIELLSQGPQWATSLVAISQREAGGLAAIILPPDPEPEAGVRSARRLQLHGGAEQGVRVWSSGPRRGAPREVASVSPGPARFAFDATHGGVHGLFSAQQREAGAQRQQEEAGQEVGAYHLVRGRRGEVTGCRMGRAQH